MPYLSVGSDKIHYFHHDQHAKTNLLMIHGAGGDHTHWPIETRKLANTNVYALDLPGHGKSSGSGSTTIENYADFTENFIKKLGPDPVTLCGHSMGGAIAMTLALRKPSWMEKLILVGTGARLKVNPMIFELIEKDFNQLIQMAPQFLYGPDISPLLAQAGTAAWEKISPEILKGDFQACDHFNIMDQVSQIPYPTLILVGSHDQMTPPKHSEYLAAHLPQASLQIIPEAGHMVALEKPQDITQAVKNFL